MPGRIVRSSTAERVAELLGSREGRKHLAEYGWVQGMPVVMTQPNEFLDDVMGLVSVHNRPVLIAMCDQSTADLQLLHVSPPNPALQVVDEAAPRTRVHSLFEEAGREGMLTVRVKYWKYSAVVNSIPVYRPTVTQSTVSYRH